MKTSVAPRTLAPRLIVAMVLGTLAPWTTASHAAEAAQPATAVAAAPAAAATPATAAQPEGWYPRRVNHAQFLEMVDIPPKKGVMIIDSRPAARRYDVGHVPGAVNIPDTQFEKLVKLLPADKATHLVFYCGGLDCMLSHSSAFKAEKLGYTKISVYAEGLPEWEAKGGRLAISLAHVQKLVAEKAPVTLIDARPPRVAAKGMIPGAINISDTEFDKQLDKLPKDKSAQLVYYCGGLECTLSENSARRARELGYRNVLTFPGGYPAWAEAEQAAAPAGPAATAAAPAPSTTLVAGKEKGSVTVVSFQAVYQATPQALLVVDVREPKEFNAGTIRGAINLPINQLEKQIATLPANKPVVFVCGTGARSGEAYDMVKLLRNDVQAWFLDADAKFHGDGSFTLVAHP